MMPLKKTLRVVTKGNPLERSNRNCAPNRLFVYRSGSVSSNGAVFKDILQKVEKLLHVVR